jgi:putative endopeptidase
MAFHSRRHRRHGKSRFRTRRHHTTKKVPIVPTLQENIKPGNDFYKYVNGKWQHHVHMPPYLSSFGVSEEMEVIVEKQLKAILYDCRSEVLKKESKRLSNDVVLLGTLAQSILHTPSQKENVRYLRKMVSNLNCIRSLEDVGGTLGDFTKSMIPSHINVYVGPMEKKTNINYICFAYDRLGLPDTSYYLLGNSEMIHTLNHYSKLLGYLGKEFDVEHLEQLISLEKMAAKFIENSMGDQQQLYSGKQLLTKYKFIPWLSYVNTAFTMTPEEFKKHTFLLITPSWFVFLNRCFRTLTLDLWKIWLAGNMINHFLPLLPPPYDNKHFELFGKRLRGQNEKVPQHQLAFQVASEWAKGCLGKLYIEKHVSSAHKREAEKLVEYIREATEEHLRTLDWLQPETRKKAVKKVDKIMIGVAYPEKMYEFHSPVFLDPTNLVKNVVLLANAQFETQMKKVGNLLQAEKWEDSVFAVNAYYYNEGNRLILPAGILQWPFFNSGGSPGWNYGGIGATVGHEITHAFDMDGKNYDEDGNLDPWWKPADNRQFNKRTKQLIQLYNDTLYFNKPINGVLTLSENIADLGGLGIAISALKKYGATHKYSPEKMKHELCDLFLSYAVSWRTKERREKAIQGLFMDVHAPAPSRVNNIVRHFADWYECFDVQPGDALYLPPEKRIQIF